MKINVPSAVEKAELYSSPLKCKAGGWGVLATSTVCAAQQILALLSALFLSELDCEKKKIQSMFWAFLWLGVP